MYTIDSGVCDQGEDSNKEMVRVSVPIDSIHPILNNPFLKWFKYIIFHYIIFFVICVLLYITIFRVLSYYFISFYIISYYIVIFTNILYLFLTSSHPSTFIILSRNKLLTLRNSSSSSAARTPVPSSSKRTPKTSNSRPVPLVI